MEDTGPDPGDVDTELLITMDRWWAPSSRRGRRGKLPDVQGWMTTLANIAFSRRDPAAHARSILLVLGLQSYCS